MKLVFFGTGEFGLPTLEKLLESDHKIVAVVTQPDRQKGRGWKVQPAPVKAFVGKKGSGVEVLQPENVAETEFIESLKQKEADVFVVVDYGQFLNKALLSLPQKFCINLHPSLLPKHRGAAPVNWAILNGEKNTGNTVIKLTERMDAGSIIVQEKLPIEEEEDAKELSDRLAKSGADLVLKALDMIEKGNAQFTEQDESAASYAPKLKKEQGEIDWKKSAIEIQRKVRGMQPWPNAFTRLEGKVLKILKVSIVEGCKQKEAPGTICDDSEFIVSAKEGAIQVEELQVEGKRAMQRDEFLRGHRLKKGTVLG